LLGIGAISRLRCGYGFADWQDPPFRFVFVYRTRKESGCILGYSRDIPNFGRAVLGGLAACRCGRVGANSGEPNHWVEKEAENAPRDGWGNF
jgi:hypothetical protein